MDKYNPSEIESKWQKIWEQNGLYKPDLDLAKNPFLNLMMFPYPSAEGLHVGNMYAFTGSDIYGRFKRMRGFSVFEPIGLDGFGIHSENYALKVGRHPKEQAKVSESNFYRQLRATGNAFDWSRTVETYDPDYYKWTQWVFIQMFKNGLAYRKKAPVNFCPSCKTVLADEQVIDGKCERCSSIAERRELEQWFFKITDYAERLLEGLSQIDWTEKVKIAQRNWIGKSEDTEIDFAIKGSPSKIKIITTRADTIFGATFLVLAPEHELVQKFKSEIQNWSKVEKYIETSQKKTEFERGQIKDKTGIRLEGVTTVNPVNNEEIPVYIADYVLSTYGTGAVMGVPAHDDRDFDFAKKFKLPIKPVIEQPERSDILRVHVDDRDLSDLAHELQKMGKPMEYWTPTLRRYDIQIESASKVVEMLSRAGVGMEEQLAKIENGQSFALEFNPAGVDFGTVYSGDGKHINSGFLNGLDKLEAIEKMVSWLSKRKIGGKSVHFHLRDWLISRQRYWGPPIPMINCPKCNWVPEKEENLPVLLPDVKNWKPNASTSLSVKGPLANHPEFYKVACPECGSDAQRETDVSDTFLDSSWYFFRYISTEFKDKPFDKSRVKKWLPVEMYIGGAEHSVLHLMYARFITMAFHDWGLIDFEEPFKKFYAHGLLIYEGAKMSKSKGNVIIPDIYVQKYGADTLRCYLMFLGPFSQGGDFQDAGIEGMNKFLKKVWRLVVGTLRSGTENFLGPQLSRDESQIVFHCRGARQNATSENFVPSPRVLRIMHKTIKKVTEDIENLHYNTAIAALMEWYNQMSKRKAQISKLKLETFLKLLAPFAPHMSEELWRHLNPKPYTLDPKFSIHQQTWPKYDSKMIQEKEMTIVVQVNGKVRDIIKVRSFPPVAGQAELGVQSLLEEKARESERVKKYIEGREIKKVIYVPGKIINFVVAD